MNLKFSKLAQNRVDIIKKKTFLIKKKIKQTS